jgi:hypothetical protein
MKICFLILLCSALAGASVSMRKSMKTTYIIVWFCLTILVCAFGCASAKPQDPLPASQGWKWLMTRELNLDPAIIEDYKN